MGEQAGSTGKQELDSKTESKMKKNIVISGVSGTFANARDVHEFRDNLYNKIDMITDTNNRWDIEHPHIPKRAGKLYDLENFDAGFFGVHHRQATTMDPMVRVLLEKAIEAIFDAGVHPSELEGTNTGVFIGSSFSETEITWFYDKLGEQNFAVTGLTRSMIAHRISYYLKLKGPSHNADTACSSSLFALENAYKAMINGRCDKALVGGINLCLNPYVTLQFFRLGVLSPEGKCKVFDVSGDGYVRSEAGGVLFLQNADEARRIYSYLINAKLNCDGYKPQSINFPSKESQGSLLTEIYEESNIDARMLSYMEAHGTATYVGDPEEVAAIDTSICSKRDKPLLVGSVKSNVGHSEPSSGFSSVVKVLLIMESGIIPPNLHYTKPRKGVEALEQGRLQVVLENTPLQDSNGIIGISSFGFGGANAHVILKWNEKEKVNDGLPKDDLPRLVCVSGRTTASILSILDDIKSRKMDAEYIRLYHQIFSKDTVGHFYRGYSILTKSGETRRSVDDYSGNKPPLVFIFGDIDSTWHKITKDLLQLSLFKSAINKIRQVLIKKDIDINELVVKNGHSMFLDKILAIVVTQVALIDVFKSLDLQPDYVFALRFENILENYFKNTFTLEETVLQFYDRIFNVKETNTDISVKFEQLQIMDNKMNESSAILRIGCVKSEIMNSQRLINFGENNDNNLFVSLLESLGSLYNYGFTFDASKLYPEIQYPVSRSTPMISPLIKWMHDEDWFVVKLNQTGDIQSNSVTTEIDFSDDNWTYVSGHMIEDRNLFPATGYLMLVWDALAKTFQRDPTDMQAVFEDCKFLRATNISSKEKIKLLTRIQKGSGNFEIVDNNVVVVTGRIYVPKEAARKKIHTTSNGTTNKSEGVPMTTKDVYKELRLRGYNYKGEFRKIVEFNKETSSGLIEWNSNFVTFMDNMLQLKILQLDTRMLYVPVSIQRLYMDSNQHITFAETFGEKATLPVYLNEATNTITCGGIEIRGMKASSIAKKKIVDEPVLEKYDFVPNETKLSIHESLRVNMQIALENSPTNKIKVVEVTNDSINENLLASTIYDVLSDIPSLQADVVALTKQPLNLPNVRVLNKPLVSETDCNIVISTCLISKPNLRNEAFKSIKENGNGFLLSREDLSFDVSKLDDNAIDILTVHTTNTEKLVLFKKSSSHEISRVIDVSDETEFSWLSDLKTAIRNKENVVIYSQNKATSGIMGLINCIRREPGGENVKCLFTDNKAPPFSLKDSFYRRQLGKNMVINVFKNYSWGTYRHLLLEDISEVISEHCYINTTSRGDLSSLKWFEGPLAIRNEQSSEELIHVYYTSLNFKDIMLASGRLNLDSVVKDNRTQEDCLLGLEYAGRTTSGKRVMGMIGSGALGTLVRADPDMVWQVPEEWSLEDAATVPIVYGTLVYAFFIRSKLRWGSSILIHSGTGGVGQAAIHIALHHKCKVFTTVGTEAKREFLKKTFPQLKDNQIGNSRDTSFEELIHRETNGRGVDFVLNSLVEEKLQASVRCLARGGTFLEIGKFDLSNDNALQLLFLKKEASFHGIMVDKVLYGDRKCKKEINQLLLKGIKEGFVRPFIRTVFNENEIEKAFRYMTTGKHIGKVLIKLRNEEENIAAIPCPKMMKGVPRYLCNANKTYVIVGGLGGFGLELADWLVLRGAKKLVLTSRKGISNGYQDLRIRTWKSYGTTIKISTADITTKEGCEKLIKEANQLGPVEALFNLAVILKDAVLENQTEDTFRTCLGPKAYATMYLDQITREKCPELRDFVVFSSVSCGRGNGGQTNYGMANSVMERICEKRKEEGYPAVAIQWGAIADVGIVADMQEDQILMEIGGTLQQRILSCLQVLDIFLKQNNPVVSSMVVAIKSEYSQTGNLVEVVAKILGIKDLKTVSMHSSLSELGMDSMTSVEIQQTLEREFQILLSPQDVRNLTFSKLQEMREKLEDNRNETIQDETKNNLDMLLRISIDEEIFKKPLITLPSNKSPVKIIFLPGIEGFGKTLEPLSRNLNAEALCLQYCYNTPKHTMKELVENAVQIIKPNIAKTKRVNLIGYSYGTILALEVMSILEKEGYQGTLILLDGAPEMIHNYFKGVFDAESEARFETSYLCRLISLYTSPDIVSKNKDRILQAESLEKRLDIIETISPKESSYSSKYIRQLTEASYLRTRAIKDYKPSFKIKSKVTLYKPTSLIVSGLAEDYELSNLCEQPVNVKTFEGNHVTILENIELAKDINNLTSNFC